MGRSQGWRDRKKRVRVAKMVPLTLKPGRPGRLRPRLAPPHAAAEDWGPPLCSLPAASRSGRRPAWCRRPAAQSTLVPADRQGISGLRLQQGRFQFQVVAISHPGTLHTHSEGRLGRQSTSLLAMGSSPLPPSCRLNSRSTTLLPPTAKCLFETHHRYPPCLSLGTHSLLRYRYAL